MSDEFVSSDTAILDLLRKGNALTVGDLAGLMNVTATAVRQRLTRLIGQGYIRREVVRAGRGRPNHVYSLTEKGRRKTGANFADLAIALWKEIRQVQDVEVRRGLLNRIAGHLAALYRANVEGETARSRMQSLAAMFNDRQIPFEVDESQDLPVLNAVACPYPELAEQDRTICSVERMLFSELIGENVRLSQCRLDGDSCCSFELTKPSTPSN